MRCFRWFSRWDYLDDFSFGGRTENGHEMVLEFVSGSDLGLCSSPCLEPDLFKGVLVPSLAGKLPKTETKMEILVS